MRGPPLEEQAPRQEAHRRREQARCMAAQRSIILGELCPRYIVTGIVSQGLQSIYWNVQPISACLCTRAISFLHALSRHTQQAAQTCLTVLQAQRALQRRRQQGQQEVLCSAHGLQLCSQTQTCIHTDVQGSCMAGSAGIAIRCTHCCCCRISQAKRFASLCTDF